MEELFGSYLHRWLYGEHGYYRKALIGKDGDFYTAVSASKFFGGSIAYFLLSLLENGKINLPLSIIEIGTHNANLIVDIYEFLSALSEGVLEHTSFYIIEPLEELRNNQQYMLRLKGYPIIHAKNLQDIQINTRGDAFFVSNELFDAFSCELILNNKLACIINSTPKQQKTKPISESSLDLQSNPNDNPKLIWRDFNAIDSLSNTDQVRFSKAFAFAERYGITTGEVPIFWETFVQEICSFSEHFRHWHFISFDYAPLGNSGGFSLRGYKQHRVLGFDEIIENLPILFGDCDITYDVDFTILHKLFAQYGARLIQQARLNTMLVDFGIISLLESYKKYASMKVYEREVLGVRTLLSGGLGERFMGVWFSGG